MPSFGSSAAYRIAFTYSAAFALAIATLGIAVYFAADANFRSQLDSRIQDESTEVARAYHDRDLQDLHEAITRREAGALANTYGYALFDRAHGGRRVWGGLRTTMPPAGFRDILFEDPQEGADPARALATDLPDGLRLVVALDPEELEQLEGIILGLFGGAFVLVVILGAVGALLLGGYLRHRLSWISGTAAAIVSGDLERRVPISARADEFDQVGGALNAMLDRIAQLMENLRQVSSDVAHDLRTPLLRLRNQLELVGSVEGAAAKAIDQGDALLALFTAILRIAEVEGGGLSRSFGPVDLSALATDLAESYQPALADSGRSLTWQIDHGIVVPGDRELVAQAIINLLDNARIHTPPGTHILLALDADDAGARLSIADDGPGVPARDRERILQRFARAEASRTTPGNGLGLSFVAAVATAHGGHVHLADNAPGLRVALLLPRLAS